MGTSPVIFDKIFLHDTSLFQRPPEFHVFRSSDFCALVSSAMDVFPLLQESCRHVQQCRNTHRNYRYASTQINIDLVPLVNAIMSTRVVSNYSSYLPTSCRTSIQRITYIYYRLVQVKRRKFIPRPKLTPSFRVSLKFCTSMSRYKDLTFFSFLFYMIFRQLRLFGKFGPA